MIQFFRKLFDGSNDPVRNCQLYREKGCSHVDGFLCDYPSCSMLKDYLKERDLDADIF